MIRSWKNKEFTNSLSNQELIDFYGCVSHHVTNPRTNRKYCCGDSYDSKNNHNQCETTDCPCKCPQTNDTNHFCTTNSITDSNSSCCATSHNTNNPSPSLLNNESSLIVCENYAPSYTSKKDQIQSLKKDVGRLRKSKSTLKKAMEDLDKLMEDNFEEEKYQDLENLNSVERFYRSKNFIGSSMNIKSLKDQVPRTDIKPNEYCVVLRNLNTKPEPLVASPLFGFFRSNIFADRDILQNELFKKSYGRTILDQEFKLKPKSMNIFTKST